MIVIKMEYRNWLQDWDLLSIQNVYIIIWYIKNNNNNNNNSNNNIENKQIITWVEVALKI